MKLQDSYRPTFIPEITSKAKDIDIAQRKEIEKKSKERSRMRVE
jgi:hypothetical protein